MRYVPPKTRTYLDELTRISIKALKPALTPPDHPDKERRTATVDYPGVGRVTVTTTDVRIGMKQLPIAWKPAQYGSYQAYFKCPGCGARRMHMYNVGIVRWVCRTCTGAHGRIHSLEPLPRIDRALAKIDAQLERPNVNGHRGMGAEQRHQLMLRKLDLQCRRDALLLQSMKATLRRIDPAFFAT